MHHVCHINDTPAEVSNLTELVKDKGSKTSNFVMYSFSIEPIMNQNIPVQKW